MEKEPLETSSHGMRTHGEYNGNTAVSNSRELDLLEDASDDKRIGERFDFSLKEGDGRFLIGINLFFLLANMADIFFSQRAVHVLPLEAAGIFLLNLPPPETKKKSEIVRP